MIKNVIFYIYRYIPCIEYLEIYICICTFIWINKILNLKWSKNKWTCKKFQPLQKRLWCRRINWNSTVFSFNISCKSLKMQSASGSRTRMVYNDLYWMYAALKYVRNEICILSTYNCVVCTPKTVCKTYGILLYIYT